LLLAALPHAAPGEQPAAAAPGPPSGPATHPRLWLRPDVVRRLKAKAAAGDPDWLALRKEADRLSQSAVASYDRDAMPRNTIPYAYQGVGWFEAVIPLGIAYQATGAKKYARKVAEILAAANATVRNGNLEPIQADKGFPSRSAALAVALGFDWIYAELSPAERAATVATLNRWFDSYKTDALDPDGPAQSNYFGGHLVGFGAAGYATLGDNPRANEITQHFRVRFERSVAPAFARGPFAGGYPLEGYVYGTNHYQRILEYLMMAGDAPGAGAAARGYAEKMARNLFHALKPNGWQVPEEADYPGDSTGILTLDLPMMLTQVLAGTPTGAGIQYFVLHAGRPPHGLGLGRSPATALIYGDRGRPAKDYALSEPLVYHSPGDEHLFMRSAWSAGAVWASFNGGLAEFSAHQARAGGHLAVQRGNDPLLVYAGQWKGGDGVNGRPQQFQTTSAYANTLFVDDGGEYLYNEERYLGGQSPFADAKPLPHHQRADVSWAKLDATAMYERKQGREDAAKRSLRLFVRNFVYVAPDIFVLFDRVRVLKPSYRKEIRFHFGSPSSPVVNANLTTTVTGSSKLAVRTLLPVSPGLKIEWNTAGGQKLSPRLAVADGKPGTDLDALNVVSVGDSRAAPRASVMVRAEGGEMIGALVRGAKPAERDTVVMFAAAATGPALIAAGISYRVTTAGSSRHYLFDLPPSRTFAVRVSGGPDAQAVFVAPDGPGGGARLKANEAGVLSFEIKAGQAAAYP
jgi:hypothetical protein